MKLYSITNKTSSLHIGAYPGRTADEALDAFYSDAGYSCRIGATRALETTVEALLADLIVAEYDYADDLETLARMMVEMDRDSGECTADVLDDADAGSSDHWDATGVYDVAEEMGLSAATVDAIGWPAIRDAYAAAWRAAVELDLAARADDDAVRWERDPDTRGGEVSSRAIPRAQARGMVAALVAAGWGASDAPDHDDPAFSWVYRVRDDAENAADGVPLRLTAGRRVDLDGVPHLLVGTFGCEPEHGDGTREADLLVEAGILGKRVALREERCWAYPILHDDRGLAVAACPEVAPYLAARIEVAS